MSRLFIDDGFPAEGGDKVMLATPVYQDPDASYTFAMSKSREALHKVGIRSAFVLFSGNCHVDDSRNKIVSEFLNSDCTSLVFIDADVSWDERDLVELCQHELPVVGGVYGFRRDGTDDAMPFQSKSGAMVEDGLIEVLGLPTGFMKIRRDVLEEIVLKSENFRTKKDSLPLVFERTIVDGLRWGGDLNFCRKVRECGHAIYGCTEFRLGHTGAHESHDSLGAFIRRQNDITIPVVADKIRRGVDRPEDLMEAIEFIANPWGACLEVMMVAVAAARQADGPIIESGSGLTTIFMAAATEHIVYCIEHDKTYAEKMKEMALASGVGNIMIIHAEIKDGWYDLEGLELPARFSVGLNDGPARALGDRMKFFDFLSDRIDLIVADDADEAAYAEKMRNWAGRNNRDIIFPDFRSAIIKERAA